jgi:hypothetical protein
MADKPLPEYLDQMIYSLYGVTQRGYGYVAKYPLHTEVVEFIEDEKTGRPVPIEDSADHFLLRTFDRVRRDLFQDGRIPKANGLFGRVVSYQRGTSECSECSGEIPWRNMHREKSDETR